jgi:hypothetical protein
MAKYLKSYCVPICRTQCIVVWDYCYYCSWWRSQYQVFSNAHTQIHGVQSKLGTGMHTCTSYTFESCIQVWNLYFSAFFAIFCKSLFILWRQSWKLTLLIKLQNMLTFLHLTLNFRGSYSCAYFLKGKAFTRLHE